MAKKKKLNLRPKVIPDFSRLFSNRNELPEPDTILQTNADNIPCIGNRIHMFSSILTELKITSSGQPYRIMNITVPCCDICKNIIYDEKSITQINNLIAEKELQLKRKMELVKCLAMAKYDDE